MNNTLLPDDSEMDYRKNHYTYAQKVLDGIIFCAICNVDLKQNIVMNEKIMVHKTFLCLCCKNCFEKLKESPSGCILCSMETDLKTCEICNHHMCQGCIYNYYMKSKKIKKLKGCLKCSCSVLWSLRSQAFAVLKFYSSELDIRLLLNGEESEDKQHLYEYLKNSAKKSNEENQRLPRIKTQNNEKTTTHFSTEKKSHLHNLLCDNSNITKPANVSPNIFINLGEIEIKSEDKFKGLHNKEKFDVCNVNQITKCKTKFNLDDKNLSKKPMVCLQNLDEEFINNNIGKICKTKLCSATVNQITKNNIKLILNDEKLSMKPMVYLQKLDEEFINNNIEQINKNEDKKVNSEEGTTSIAKKPHLKKKSENYNCYPTYYKHKKFRRE